MIELYSKVRLKTGEIATILEDFGDGVFLAEVFMKSGELDTTEVKLGQIASVFEELEKPLVTV